VSESKPVIRLDERLRESPRVPCPQCGKAVHPDVMCCPHCGVHYAETAGELHRGRGRSLSWAWSRPFVVVVVVLMLGIMILQVLAGTFG